MHTSTCLLPRRIRLRAVLALLLVLPAGSALAQAAANCTLALSPDSIDFGSPGRTAVGAGDAQSSIGERDLQLSVNCSSAGALNLQLQAPPAAQGGYLFGSDGRFKVTVDSATLDGASVDVGTAPTVGAAPGQIGAQTAWTEGTVLLPVRAGAAAHGSHFSARLRLQTFAPATATQIRDQVAWDTRVLLVQADGSASRELRVQAAFAPAACTLALNKNVAALGTIPSSTLNPSTDTALPQDSSTTFAIDCDAPVRFALATHDQRAGSAASTGALRFGLGMSPSGEKIGSFTVFIPDATDATAGALTGAVSNDNGASWVIAADLGPARLVGFRRSGDPAASGPSALDHVTGTLRISAWITRADALTLTQAVPIDGLITLELKYL